jgi:hypothetical protein
MLRAQPILEFGRAQELDKMSIDQVVKRAQLNEKDWYYLENRIRGQIHDMMQPLFIKADQAKDAVREMREQVNSNRATIEDLAMGQMRLQRYDEYFMDSNKKLNGIEVNMRLQDKRITDEVTSLAQHKDKLINKIGSFEHELQKFKDTMMEREQNTLGLLEEV